MSWAGTPSPVGATAQWHRDARERDEAAPAQGPVDMAETTDGPWSGAPEERETDLITDPALRLLDPVWLEALRDRYARTAGSGDFSERYANACDLVVQLLWPEMYGTDPGDPNLHTSVPARQIAHLFCDVLGVREHE